MTPTLFPKECPKCKITKQPEEFHKDRRNKTGLTSWCNSCRRLKTKEWVKRNSEKVKSYKRNAQLKRLYGISLSEYQEKLKAQGNACAICFSKTPGGKGNKFVVDHCHKTNKTRDLLCSKCNCAIGLLNENPLLFEAAKNYLKHHNG